MRFVHRALVFLSLIPSMHFGWIAGHVHSTWHTQHNGRTQLLSVL
jgi:hypothetical protein